MHLDVGQVGLVLAVAAVDAELVEQLAEADVRRALVDDQAHGAFGRMRAHIDDRARKALVGHDRHGHQQLPVEVAVVVVLALPGRSHRLRLPPRSRACEEPEPRRTWYKSRSVELLPAAACVHRMRADNEAIMSRFLTAACASVAFAFAAIGPAAGQGNVPVAIASPWVSVHTTRVRLVAGAGAARGAKSYVAGIEIVLAEGWKTYWRNPGDAGRAAGVRLVGLDQRRIDEGALSGAVAPEGARRRDHRLHGRGAVPRRGDAAGREETGRAQAAVGVRHLPRDLHPGAVDAQPGNSAQDAGERAAVGDPCRACARASPAGAAPARRPRAQEPDRQPRRAGAAARIRGALCRAAARVATSSSRRPTASMCRCPSGCRMRRTGPRASRSTWRGRASRPTSKERRSPSRWSRRRERARYNASWSSAPLQTAPSPLKLSAVRFPIRLVVS